MTDERDEYEALMDELKKTANVAAEDHGWDGTVFPPGKMEGCPWWVPYLYQQIVLEGDGETCGVWECSELTDEERDLFQLMDIAVVGIREDDNGFVCYKLMTDAEYMELQLEAQFDREHP